MPWKPEPADFILSGASMAAPVAYEFAKLAEPDCGQPRCEQNYFSLVIRLGERHVTTFHMGLN